MPYKDKRKQNQYVRDYMRDQREILKMIKKQFPATYQQARRLLENKSAVIKVGSVFFIGIFILAFVWWVSHQFFVAFQSAGSSMIQTMETNSTRTDLIETFFSNVDTYILFIALIVLGLWVLQRSQKKGELVYET